MTPAAQMSTLRPYLKKKTQRGLEVRYVGRHSDHTLILKVPAKCSCSSHPVSAMISGATYVGVPQTV